MKLKELNAALADCIKVANFDEVEEPTTIQGVCDLLIDCDTDMTAAEKKKLKKETKEAIKFAKLFSDDVETAEEVEEIEEEDIVETEEEELEEDEVGEIDTVEDEQKKQKPNQTKKSDKKRKEVKKEGNKEEKVKKEKGPGVIATIVECIEKAGKKGISKEDILTVLTDTFPNKEPNSMKNTINVQIPNRITKEKFEVIKLDNGNYCKK